MRLGPQLKFAHREIDSVDCNFNLTLMFCSAIILFVDFGAELVAR
jgi:hypothetical protein